MNEYYVEHDGEIFHAIATTVGEDKCIIHKVLEKDTGLWDFIKNINEVSDISLHSDWIVKDDRFGTKEKYPEYFI